MTPQEMEQAIKELQEKVKSLEQALEKQKHHTHLPDLRMNIKIKKTGTVHDFNSIDMGSGDAWLRCGRLYHTKEYLITTEPLTCKTCIKLEAKK